MSGKALSEDRSQRALEIAYRYIDARERTIAEVGAKLTQAGIAPEHAQAAIEELRILGSVDDVRFARLFAQDKRELEHWGAERIARGLAARGIDRELIDATLAESQPEDELQRASAVLARRFPQPPADRRERERALGFLLRKGYEADVALEAIRVSGRAAPAADDA